MGYKKKAKKPTITWNAMLKIEDTRVRESRWGRYCLLYTNSDACIACSEDAAQKIVLFEPYLLSGDVLIRPGGVFLRLREATLFNAADFLQKES